MKSIEQVIFETGVVPVIKLDDSSCAVPLVNALLAGGIPVAEVTFRTDAAEESITRICAETPDVLVGAGTVINSEQVDRAYAAGAKFIVSPGFSTEVVKRAQELSLPIFPGCTTPSEIMAAITMGLNIVKFFPAENYGGLKTIKSLSAAFPKIKFMPTGGIGPVNLVEYLQLDKIIACGGSWMVKDDLDEVTKLCVEARELVEEVRK